jgi:hypothetical protein
MSINRLVTPRLRRYSTIAASSSSRKLRQSLASASPKIFCASSKRGTKLGSASPKIFCASSKRGAKLSSATVPILARGNSLSRCSIFREANATANSIRTKTITRLRSGLYFEKCLSSPHKTIALNRVSSYRHKEVLLRVTGDGIRHDSSCFYISKEWLGLAQGSHSAQKLLNRLIMKMATLMNQSHHSDFTAEFFQLSTLCYPVEASEEQIQFIDYFRAIEQYDIEFRKNIPYNWEEIEFNKNSFLSVEDLNKRS